MILKPTGILNETKPNSDFISSNCIYAVPYELITIARCPYVGHGVDTSSIVCLIFLDFMEKFNSRTYLHIFGASSRKNNIKLFFIS